MEEWLKVSLLLCTFGFFKEIRPSEPYVTHYLLGESWKNLTQEQVSEELYPVGTYSTSALLIVVFLITDILRHKPVIVAEGIMGIAIWSLLLWGQGIPLMQLVQVLYGGFIAAEVAYYTYIYARVDRDKFHVVSGHTRAAYLMGRFASGLMAQALVSTDSMDYRELNYITLGAMFVATAWALLLPSAKFSTYFHRSVSNNNLGDKPQVFMLETKRDSCNQEHLTHKKKQEWLKLAFKLIWKDLIAAYTNTIIIKWSIWWALATCGFYQVLNYTQLLWEEIIAETGQELYNGGVEAAYTIIGAMCALGLGVMRVDWSILGAPLLAVCALAQAASLYVTSSTHNLWVAYGCYIACLVFYQALVTIASAEVAKQLSQDSYALIFGMNTFIALALQSILTAIVLNWLQLPPREQFVVYGSYFAGLGVLFVGVTVQAICQGDWSKLTRQSFCLPKPSANAE